METKTPISDLDLKSKEEKMAPEKPEMPAKKPVRAKSFAQKMFGGLHSVQRKGVQIISGISTRLQPLQKRHLNNVAQLECAFLRVRHRIVRALLDACSGLLHLLFVNKLLRIIGDFFYAMGFQTEYRLVLMARAVRKFAYFFSHNVMRRVLRIARLIWREIVIVWRELFRPFFVFGRGIYRLIAHGVAVSKQRNIFFGIWASVTYLFRGLFRYLHVLPGMISYFLPVVAAFGFAIVFQNTVAQHYTLEVQVEGKTVGYVSDEMVFTAAKNDVKARVAYLNTSEHDWDISPTYRISTAPATLNETQMADAILEASSEKISEGTAVYVDGNLRYVTDDITPLENYLAQMLAPFAEDADPTLRLAFTKKIEYVPGIYFTDSFTPVQEIVDYFSGLEAAQLNYTVVSGDSWSLIASKNHLTQGEVFAMNPGMSASTSIFPGDQIIIGLEKAVLEVLVYRTIEYDEAIAFTKTKTESSDYNFGTTKVTQQGVDGVRHIVAEVTYDANGNLLHTEITSNVVTQEPVEQIEVVGTYLPSGMIAQVGNGTFIWPVPNYRYVSRWAHASHNGIDICAPAGTPIYAVDSGVVIKSGYNRGGAGNGYGWSIVIDHGNGYQTLYGHGLSVAVSVGDVVSQGDYIMPMGSTGRSTGNHLHFEIHKNGDLVWPQSIYSQSLY